MTPISLAMAADGEFLLNSSFPSPLVDHQIPDFSYNSQEEINEAIASERKWRVIGETSNDDIITNFEIPNFSSVSPDMSESSNLDPGFSTVKQHHSVMPRSTDPDFYEQLVKMKEVHRKTLERCERLYLQKVEELGLENNRDVSNAEYLNPNISQKNESEHDPIYSSSESVINVPHLVILENRIVSDVVRNNSAENIESINQNVKNSNTAVFEHQEILHRNPPTDNIIDLSGRLSTRSEKHRGSEKNNEFEEDEHERSEVGTLERRKFNDGLRGSSQSDGSSEELLRYNDGSYEPRHEEHSLERHLHKGSALNSHRRVSVSLTDEYSGSEHEGSVLSHNDTRQIAMERITDMWREFSVSDCQDMTTPPYSKIGKNILHSIY